MNYWVHHLDPFILRFPAGCPIEGIRWYGCAYFLGFWCALLLLKVYANARKIVLSREQQGSLLFYLLCGILLGGRLGYVCLYDMHYYWQQPQQILAFWRGGMSSHGGFIGVYLAVLLFAKKYQFNVWSMTDLVVSLVPIGIFLGRLANFVNAEVGGRITELPWAVIFPYDSTPRHPSQLYEAAGEGLGLLLWTQIRIWSSHCTQKCPGRLTGECLIYYSAMRIFLECFREPDAPLIMNMTRGQFYSVFLLIVGLLLVVKSKRRVKGHNVFED